MEDQLNELDRQMLPSGTAIRWRNKVQWTRNTLVNEGLMASDSSYGVWEISEAGREYLQEANA
jgi:restriction endonuclease Mrr